MQEKSLLSAIFRLLRLHRVRSLLAYGRFILGVICCHSHSYLALLERLFRITEVRVG